MTLTELCFHLRNRRGMYLPDGRYASAVAFVEGFNQALDGAPLDGFGAFVSRRLHGGESPVRWDYLIARTKAPDTRLDQIPPELDGELTDMLVEFLEEFAQR
ncbi:hypothetical protein JIG36_04970 [Actinoplanes sp. LDG1-06]|uniref:Uncharacterized protein n=1 Tax=Paractinoplanes ovalisporus TaxID=2810368 RepID=A0ABS2A4Y8_9ACTN|nr:hypothetical protein [Actinoplanes ovalisporus]MBM2614909.1 hypothetical protein [Actinoplanes ovalisporus]